MFIAEVGKGQLQMARSCLMLFVVPTDKISHASPADASTLQLELSLTVSSHIAVHPLSDAQNAWLPSPLYEHSLLPFDGNPCPRAAMFTSMHSPVYMSPSQLEPRSASASASCSACSCRSPPSAVCRHRPSVRAPAQSPASMKK